MKINTQGLVASSTGILFMLITTCTQNRSAKRPSEDELLSNKLTGIYVRDWKDGTTRSRDTIFIQYKPETLSDGKTIVPLFKIVYSGIWILTEKDKELPNGLTATAELWFLTNLTSKTYQRYALYFPEDSSLRIKIPPANQKILGKYLNVYRFNIADSTLHVEKDYGGLEGAPLSYKKVGK